MSKKPDDNEKKESLSDHFKRHVDEIKTFFKTDTGKSIAIGSGIALGTLVINYFLHKRLRDDENS